jgi:nitroreductase
MLDKSSVSSILESHTSVRKFNQRQFSHEEVAELVQTAQCAATSNFRQAYSVVWLRDEATRLKVGELAINEQQFATCGAAFVVCVDFQRMAKACELHGKEILADTAENMLIGVVDAAIFAQTLAVAAEAKGLGVCYIGGVRTNIEAISELLHLPDLVFPLFGLCVGEPGAPLNAVKPRLPVDLVLFEDAYDTGRLEDGLRKYDAEINDYYLTRAGSARDATWTGDMAKAMVRDSRPFIRAFLAKKGFTFK